MLWNQLEDPNEMIEFLEKSLAEAEEMGMYAILIGHNSWECTHQYVERFRSIMDAYQKTIRFNMFGHIHQDIF